MIRDLHRWFIDHNFKWRIGSELRVPIEEDIQAALDEAARVLYDEPVGAQLTVGRLIVTKQHNTHDVYVYVGSYE